MRTETESPSAVDVVIGIIGAVAGVLAIIFIVLSHLNLL